MKKAKKSLPFLILFSVMLCTAVSFFACGKTKGPSVTFVQNDQVVSELIFSQNVPTNFVDYVKCDGVDKNSLSFEVSDSELFTMEGENFKFVRSGKSLVFAKHDDSVLATADLIVKAKYDTPSQITMDENGVLSWPEVYAYFDGQQIKADGYTLTINGQSQESDNTHSGVVNSFDLVEFAKASQAQDYNITIKAVGQSKFVDESEESASQYFFLPKMADFNITKFYADDQFRSQSATLEWDKVENAEYNIYQGGMIVAQHLTAESYVFDFSQLPGGSQTEIVVEAVYKEPAKLSIPSSAKVTVKKLDTPQLSYADDKAIWSGTAEKYILSYQGQNGEGDGTLDSTSNETTLSELSQAGIYKLEVQARGSTNIVDGVFYASSNVSNEEYFVKLSVGDISYRVEGQTLYITLPDDDYIQNYTLIGDNSKTWNVTRQGSTFSASLNELFTALTRGTKTLKLFAGPTKEDGQVQPYPNDLDLELKNVLSSNAREITVRVLGEENVALTHSLGPDKKSTISFKKIADATNYRITINGGNEKIVEASTLEGDESIEIGDLREIDAPDGRYQIKVVAYRTDETSVNFELDTTVTILPKATKALDQTNGYYAWNADSRASYYYEIYKVDKDFVVGNPVSGPAVQSGEGTMEGGVVKNDQMLDLGHYYYIKVYTRSGDNNDKYLAADFKDDTLILEEKFVATDTIETPTVVYDKKENSITITTVAFAQEYKIVFGEHLGLGGQNEVVLKNSGSASGQSLQYKFSSDQFARAGEYEVIVTASAGDENDPVLHPQSAEKYLSIIRLETPSLSSGNIERKGDRLTFIASKPQHCKEVEVYFDDTKQTLDENLRIDISDKTEYLLHIVYVEEDDNGDNYFLGNEANFTLRRTAAPKNLKYVAAEDGGLGVVTFACDNSTFEGIRYIFAISVNYGDRAYSFEATPDSVDEDEGLLTFNFKEAMEDEIAADPDCDLAWSQKDNITIKALAYKCDFVSMGAAQIFYIPSYFGQTDTDKNELKLEKLASPEITYDTKTRTLQWDNVGDDGQTKYFIYVDEESRENVTSNTYNRFSDDEFLTAKKVYIKAINSNYLTPSQSNEIWIKKLAAVSELQIFKDEGGAYKASLSTTEGNRVSGVVIGQKPQLALSQAGSLSFNISEYVSENKLEIKLVATPQASNHYFEDSSVSTFDLNSIEDGDISFEIADGQISWERVASEDFAQNITYTLVISSTDGKYQNTFTTKELYFKLDNEDFVNLVESGQYNLKVTASVDRYTIKLGEEGFYGIKDGQSSPIKKLPSVTSPKVSVVDGQIKGNSPAYNRVQFTANLTFSDVWQGEDVEFDVYVNDVLSTIDASPRDGQYVLELEHTLFNEGDNEIKIYVKSKTSIISNVTTLSLPRYGTVKNLKISEDGVVEFEGDCKNYLVVLTFDDINFTSQEVTGNTVDLMEKFGDNVGTYYLEVVGYDQECEFLPSISVATFDGFRLAGIESATITDTGEVEITLNDKVNIDEDVIFTANGTQFEPRRREGSATFVYTMIEFVRDLKIESDTSVKIELNVRKLDNVSAQAENLEFEYKKEDSESSFARGRNYADDYFKFIFVDNTSAFNIMLKYFDENGEQMSTGMQILPAADHQGYWVKTTGEDGNELEYFSTTQPDGSRENTTNQCFAISLNDLLKENEYHNFELAFSRIVKGDKMVQYSQVVLPLTKLLEPQDLGLSDGVLNWTPSSSSEARGYYVYFKDEAMADPSYIKQLLNSSLDLTKEKLAPGSTHYLSVAAVSANYLVDGKYVIASDPLTTETGGRIYKHTIPAQIAVENGKLMFDKTAVENSDLFTAIKDNYNGSGEDFLLKIYSSIFKDIFTLSNGDVSSPQIRLRFESETKAYSAVVPAIELLPSLASFTFEANGKSISYFEAFKEKYNNVTNSEYEPKRKLQSFYEAIQKADGIADDEMLFDEFGVLIPAGLYNIKAQQEGSDTLWNIASGYSEQATASAVTCAPKMVLDTTVDQGQTNYLVKFQPVNLNTDTTTTEQASIYTLRFENEVYTYLFKVKLDEGVYKLISVTRKNGDKDVEFSGFDFTLTQDSSGFVIMNVTQLIKLFKEEKYQDKAAVAADVRFIKIGSYEFTIYAQGNGYAISSKNELVTINLLGINAKDIHLNNGVLYWTTSQKFEDLKTGVKYKRNSNQAVTELKETIPFVDGRATLNLTDDQYAGYYEFIILYIQGSIGQSVMNVDSDLYMIKDVFKQQRPTQLTLDGNCFNLPYNDLSAGTASKQYYTNNYEIANNVDTSVEEFSSAANGKNKFYPSTQGATQYSITRLGNTTDFSVVLLKNSDADYELTVTADISACILASEPVTKDAKMLKAVDEITVSDLGEIEWSPITTEDGKVQWAKEENTLEDFELEEDKHLVYQVNVYTKLTLVETLVATYYTTTTSVDTIVLGELNLRPQDELIFEVRPLIVSDGGQDITTVENKKFKLDEISINVPNGERVKAEFVLAGKAYSIDQLNERPIQVAPAPTGVTTKNGKLVWTISESVYASGVIDEKGNYYFPEQSGDLNYEFVPKLAYDNGKAHTLKVFTFGGKQNPYLIKSKAVAAKLVQSENVYKLPEIENGDFELTQDDEKIVISFKSLFENKTIRGTTNSYKVKMTITNSDGGTTELYSREVGSREPHSDFVLYTDEKYSATSSFHECFVDVSQIAKITYQVVDNQATAQDCMTINGEEYVISDINFEGEVSVDWDPATYRFNFTTEDENLYYHVTLKYADGKTEEAEVSTKYYYPKKVGTITSIVLRVRKEDGFYTNTEPLTGRWDYNLFNGGLGTAQQPYLIANQSQFSNIHYRNSTDQYFALARDITLSEAGFVFEEDFLANLDGKQFTLTATIKPVSLDEAIRDNFAHSLYENQTVEFVGAGAIFKQIGSAQTRTGANGSISNLKLNLTFNCSAELQSQLAVGLALYNYGSITGVTVTSSTTNYSRGATVFAQAELVGHNHAIISDCKNEASISVTAYSANVIVGGLVLSNNLANRSSVTRCFNEGQIQIEIYQSRNNRAWASGVVLNNYSTLSQSGNNGKININGETLVSAIVSGVCLSSSGTIEYCFNNSQLGGESVTNVSVAGVAFVLSNGVERYLVDTAGQRIVYSCGSISSSNTNYTDSTEGSSTLQTNRVPKSLNQPCGGGHNLIIENGKASIS